MKSITIYFSDTPPFLICMYLLYFSIFSTLTKIIKNDIFTLSRYPLPTSCHPLFHSAYSNENMSFSRKRSTVIFRKEWKFRIPYGIFVYTTKRFEVRQSSGSGRSKIAVFRTFQVSTPFYEILKTLQESANFDPKKSRSNCKIRVGTVLCTSEKYWTRMQDEL